MKKLKTIVEEAIATHNKDHDDAEEAKRNTFRAGSAGIITPNGANVGACVRKAYLRSQGVEIEQTDMSTQIMFAGGRNNENQILEWLLNEYKPEQIKQEEDLPIEFETAAGDKVTGRPDFILLDNKGRPERGIEAKHACSLWTARTVICPPQEPKFDHMSQAAVYSMKVGEMLGQMQLPYTLMYTSYVYYAIGFYGGLFPNPGEVSEDLLEFKSSRSKKTGEIQHKPFRLRPFVQVFDINFPSDKDPLHYKVEDGDKWVSSRYITRDNIHRYYDTLSDIKASPKSYNLTQANSPNGVNADGSKSAKRECDYCPLAATCRDAEKKNLTMTEFYDKIQSVQGVSVVDASLNQNKEKIND